MSSDVDICNMALGQIGDSATVSSINPPEGSAQAEHCARFYPMVRDALIEMHEWSFATVRARLTPLVNTSSQWAYCYAAPRDMVNPIAVLHYAVTDDMAELMPVTDPWQPQDQLAMVSRPAPQPYVLETLDSGAPVIYTNQAEALLRYTLRVTDPTRFSPLFVRAFAAALSSALAGPILKGTEGERAAARWQVIAFGPPERGGRGGLFGQAAVSDANQRRHMVSEHHQVGWIAGR